MAPMEISLMVLMIMKETANTYLGKELQDTVITVPSHCIVGIGNSENIKNKFDQSAQDELRDHAEVR